MSQNGGEFQFYITIYSIQERTHWRGDLKEVKELVIWDTVTHGIGTKRIDGLRQDSSWNYIIAYNILMKCLTFNV